MSKDKFEVYMDYERFSGELRVYIYQNRPGGVRAIVTNLSKGTMKEVAEHHCVPGPTFKLGHGISKPFLQAMANELHVMGIKAEAAPVLENEVSAIKYHLEDMRALVFEDYKHEIIREEKRDGKE